MTRPRTDTATDVIVQRALHRFTSWREHRLTATDRMFAKLFVGEWLFGILIAVVVSPYAWEGKQQTFHPHLWLATLLGGAIFAFPLLLIWLRPGTTATRHVVAVAQMLFSALLIHLSGGRIETHFHVFGSLSFLAFYLDWPVLITAAATVSVDHLVRGVVWPESIYGIANPEWWRFLEHAFWVVFCVSFLIMSCVTTIKTWLAFAEEGGMMEALAEAERSASTPGAEGAATTEIVAATPSP